MQRAVLRRTLGWGGLAVVVGIVACARVRPLAGGPEDKTPPALLRAVPADSSLNLGVLPSFELNFDEAIEPGGVRRALRFYPDVQSKDIDVDGRRVRITFRDSLPADTTFVLVLGEALQDRKPRDNTQLQERWLVFGTGPSLHASAVLGRVSAKGKPEPNGVVRYEPLPPDTTLGSQALRYPVAAADAEGLFRMLGLPPNRPFRLRAFADRNNNLVLDDGELEAGVADTLVLAKGEVRRGLEWNLIDPNEPATIEGVAHYPSGREVRLAVAFQSLGDSAATDTTRTLPAPDSALALPVAPRAASGYDTEYAALEPQGFVKRRWRIVHASPRGDYSARVRGGRHRVIAWVEARADSMPSLYVSPDSTQLLWEPLSAADTLFVEPGGSLRAATIEIAPRAP